MSDRIAKAALFDGLVSAAKALSSGRRAEIVDLLAQGERSVDEIALEIEQSVANTSQHLQHLLRAGLVTGRRDGTRIHYSLAGDEVSELWAALRAVSAAHVAEIESLATAYLGDRSHLETISRTQLAKRLGRNNVVVLDVRPEAEFAAGHVTGARNIPSDALPKQVRTLPKDSEIVAYCRGPYCVYADDAVRTLRKRGFNAVRLEDGYPEWARAGLPTQTLVK